MIPEFWMIAWVRAMWAALRFWLGLMLIESTFIF